MKKQPLRLANDPILEAIAELRFEPTLPSAGDLILGMIFPEVKDVVPKIERLPFAEVPREFQDADANLRYAARQKLSGGQFALLLGDRVLDVACGRPYIGWDHFRELINRVFIALNKTGLVKQVERFSIKYVNVLEAQTRPEQYAFLDMKASLGQYAFTDHLSQLRTEIPLGSTLNIVEITAGVSIQLPQGELSHGLLFSIDTLYQIGNEFWQDPLKIIDEAHAIEKSLFYDLLNADAMKSLNPIWN